MGARSASEGHLRIAASRLGLSGNTLRQLRPRRAFGESTAGKAEARDAEQGEQEANDGGENSGSAVELGDGLEKALPVVIQGLDGDDRAQATPLPG